MGVKGLNTFVTDQQELGGLESVLFAFENYEQSQLWSVTVVIENCSGENVGEVCLSEGLAKIVKRTERV